MKKNILLFFVSLISVSLFAQKGFHIGISAAFTSNFIYTQNNYGTLAPFKEEYVRVSEMDYRFTYGGNGGFVVGYNFKKSWGLQAELRYSTAGQKYEDNFMGPADLPQGRIGEDANGNATRVNVKRVVKLTYVQIPIMAKYVSKFGKKAKMFVCLGPQFGFRTASSENVEIGGITYFPDFTSDQKFKTFDMGLALQIGAEVYATDYLFFDLGLSGYAGILDINGDGLKTFISHNDVKYQQSRNANVGIMFGVHYLFIKRNTEGF